MKSASKLFLCIACLALVAGASSAQVTLLVEDFATASGNTPPLGWSTVVNVATVGPEEWRFDNPGGRVIPPAMTSPVAIFDDDFLSSSGGMSDAELISPSFNTSGLGTVLCQFETKFVDLATSTINLEVWDGFTWNIAFTQTTPDIPVGAGTTTAVSELLTIDITTAAGGSPNARVRFHWTLGSWDFFWQVDNVNIFEPSMSLDVGVSAVLQPNAGTGALLCGPYSNNQTVQVTMTNFAFTNLPAGSMIPVQHDVDAANFVGETMTTTVPLGFGQSENYTFTTGADLTVGPGPFTLTATTAAGDPNPANDATSVVVPPAGGGAPQALPLSEDFGTLLDFTGTAAPAGWINDTTENANDNPSDGWHYDMNGTSSGVGPTSDATTGSGLTSYAFIEDSVSSTDEMAINLVSPCLDLTTALNPTLTFECWSFDQTPTPGAQINDLNIDVITYPGGAVTSGIFTVGDLGVGTWMAQAASLAPFAGGTIRIVFRGRNDNGTSFYHDLSIDDVFVFDPTPSFGQPATVGFGTLDINGAARNGANLPVSSGANGLYFVSLSLGAGDVLGLQIGGEALPGLASILFVGTALSGGIPIAPFGTVDLDPAGTLPISIVGNGFAAPPTFIDLFFSTDVNGEINLGFPVTSLMMALSPFGLSAINLTPGNGGITITNTTEVTINP